MLIDEPLAAALVAEVFPEWAHLPVRAVLPGGHDNRTFRLGDRLSLRLPSAEGYVAAVAKEQRRLPRLAAAVLPVLVPEPVAEGRWVHGDVAAGDLLVRDGLLAAVIDFGGCCVGDPACDLVLAWTWCDASAARAFRAALGLVEATWDRAAGWALWKALIGRDAAASRTIARLRQDLP